jgi:hypothetical protein
MEKLKDLEIELKKSKGKPGGFPRDINFSFDADGKILRAELQGSLDKKNCRRFDPWTFAYLAEVNSKTNAKISNVIFSINIGDANNTQNKLNLESLKRRLSFLNANNEDIQIELFVDNEKANLYDRKSLFNRPANEIIRSKISKRNDDDEPGLLEKAFQAFLYGRGLKIRTNDRLAILGEDFYQMKGKDVGILREFPTGVFNGKVTDSTRILPTEFIDLVTRNKWGNLSIIELKLDNSELEVISQILDYGLFFSCYRNQLMETPSISETFDVKFVKAADIFCYVVNNYFHPRFDSILQFYSIKTKNYGFVLKKIVLGETMEI